MSLDMKTIGKKNKILFIDDEKICHTLAELIIPNFTEYELVPAFSGTEALELAQRYANEIALVLTDIMVPDLNGYEIFRKMRKDKKLANIPFVFQSGYTNQESDLMNYVDAKHISILYKPYKQEELLAAIKNNVV